MAEFAAFDPNVEVLGITINAIVSSLGDDSIPILQKYHLYPVINDNWYNQQEFLSAFKELAEGNFLNLVAIGMKIPDNAAWPPNVVTVHDALASIGIAYQMNHRNGEIGKYVYTQTGPNSGTMLCENPYPSDFDYGLIYRTAQKFREPSSTKLIVKRDESKPNRIAGGESCTYVIEW